MSHFNTLTLEETVRIAIAGSGPVGMTAALLLARQGHRVVLVDRDPGPRDDAPWDRVGVMQFHLPHTFRAPARNVLLERLPDVYDAVVAAGAVDTGAPGVVDPAAAVHVRRPILERVMWTTTTAEPGVERLTGHVDSVRVVGGEATGLVVGGRAVDADLVVDATGRGGRLSAAHRPAIEGADAGFAYAARLYQLLPGAGPGPINGGPGFVAQHDGFILIIFTHDAGTFTVLLVRLAADDELALLREEAAFDAALRLLPAADTWTSPERARPLERVRAGAGLRNDYRPQSRSVRGLLAIGDAASTTNPTAARGVSLGMQTAAVLADLVSGAPRPEWGSRLDRWCEATLRPWYADHLHWDQSLRARWSGRPIDPAAWPAPDVVGAAAQERPDFMALLGPYFGMQALPASIDPVREEVRRMLQGGWRPAALPRPNRADLVEQLQRTRQDGGAAA